ncbi:sugar phosphate isomerase/epimerase [Candidatus Bipolaricaulota bacterium]|nr:sugar phosphate isomerase/epimerase [Candidatus Bipolaricaulota bacterium]
MRDVDDHRLPGEGSIDWPGLLRTIKAIGYYGPAVLELHPKGDPLAAIAEARKFLSSQS